MRRADTRRRIPAPHPHLLEPWFAELDSLARRRTDNLAEIDAHMARFEQALRDWQAATGESAGAYRQRFTARIDRSLAAPWPMTAARKRKLLHASDLLTRRSGEPRRQRNIK
jgi:hypothetical protein